MIEGLFSCIGGMVGVAIGIFWFMPFTDNRFENINKWQKQQEEINRMFVKYFDEIEKEFERRPK